MYISRYTGYLADVELDHAQDIRADLIGAVVAALRPNFRLAKLEGDAAFMSMPGDTIDGTMLLDTIERCYVVFRRRRRDILQATSCECNACSRIPDLDLKFVVHHGLAIAQKVAGRQEFLGLDVVVVHRLLAIEVVEGLGIEAYALFSQAAIDAAALDPAALGMREHTETYDRIGDVRTWVHDLERRWQEEEGRGVGSANHCMHRKDAVIEEILDWRPYDYVTDRTILDTPSGPVKVPRTIELEPTPDGTTIHIRSGAPKTKREKTLMEGIGPAYGKASRSALPALLVQLTAEEAAMAPVIPKPDLATPRPDGPLASLT